jgi:hypothetical protein
MSDLKFQATHRVLIKATVGHGYDLVAIDVNNGTFHRCNVEKDDTKIRVKKGVLAEKLGYNGNNDYHTPLTEANALKTIAQLNVKREELGFKPLEFWRFEEDDSK